MAKQTNIEKICRQLRNKIKSGELPAESRIVEQDLALYFGVSRTPIREVIRRLSSEGILVSVPNLGTFVKRFSLAEVREMFDIREVLEGLAFRNAVERFDADECDELLKLAETTDTARQAGRWDEAFQLDEDFHQFIINRCGSETLKQELAKFNFQTSLIRADLSAVAPRIKRREITVTHSELAQTVNDPAKAETLMREHIAGLARWLFQ
ncbi:MAG: GntR family transcriptional regulator [Victivallaceae bacterium]|nr:GntR family transcriptional regulator [Victivallaceae bacterium]